MGRSRPGRGGQAHRRRVPASGPRLLPRGQHLLGRQPRPVRPPVRHHVPQPVRRRPPARARRPRQPRRQGLPGRRRSRAIAAGATVPRRPRARGARGRQPRCGQRHPRGGPGGRGRTAGRALARPRGEREGHPGPSGRLSVRLRRRLRAVAGGGQGLLRLGRPAAQRVRVPAAGRDPAPLLHRRLAGSGRPPGTGHRRAEGPRAGGGLEHARRRRRNPGAGGGRARRAGAEDEAHGPAAAPLDGEPAPHRARRRVDVHPHAPPARTARGDACSSSSGNASAATRTNTP